MIVPILVMYGTRDRISPAPLVEPWFAELLSEDKTVIKYDEWFHELLQEPKKEVAFREVLNWMTDRCRGRIYGINETKVIKDSPTLSQM